MKNRFYFSEKQKLAAGGSGRSCYVWVGKGGVGWVEYTEWCSLPDTTCNWDDAILVHETDEYPEKIKSGGTVWDVQEDDFDDLPDPVKKSSKEEMYLGGDSEVTCDCCGQTIKRGDPIWKVRGYTYHCCSSLCLLDVIQPNYYTTPCTGKYENYGDDED